MNLASSTIPRVGGVVETCINVADMGRAREFYETLFGFEVMVGDDRFCAFRVANDVLLLFKENASEAPVNLPGGVIPPHATQGAGHFALAIAPDDLEDWRVRLRERGLMIESEVRWQRGGVSLYFRDPDKNLVELATPGVWANY
jgi:catechol 2,3-dioxygenase-like lactoylglutathione lyase family enzyme